MATTDCSRHLIFLLPSMWYWPSSLGKDGLIVLFLGIATYGFALFLRSRYGIGLLSVAFGLLGVVMIRPPMAAALAVAAAAAFLLRPARARSMQAQAVTLFVLVPSCWSSPGSRPEQPHLHAQRGSDRGVRDPSLPRLQRTGVARRTTPRSVRSRRRASCSRS